MVNRSIKGKINGMNKHEVNIAIHCLNALSTTKNEMMYENHKSLLRVLGFGLIIEESCYANQAQYEHLLRILLKELEHRRMEIDRDRQRGCLNEIYK